jgi:hypothetical protein
VTALTYIRLAIAAGLAAIGTASSWAADSVEFPARRTGYWEIHIVHDAPAGAPDMTLHACIDTSTDKAMMEAGMSVMQSMCSRHEMKRDGDAYVWDTDCAMGPMKTTSHVVLTGDFQSAYTMKITGDVTGMPDIGGLGKGPMKTAMTQSAKWVAAACPEGVKPGDMQMPGGITINANEMIKSLGVVTKPWAP